ncbi:MAG: cupin domain-containing protein [Alphaproteobacteria bacterium]
MTNGRDERNSAGPITPPMAGSRYLEGAAIEWQPTEAKGFWVKPLYENVERGERTLLMKVDAGASAPLHAHEEFEQIYVLEGSFYDQEKVLKAGDYCCRAPGAQHTAGTREGSVMLLVYTKAAPGDGVPRR